MSASPNTLIFCDASFDPKSKLAIGGYLFLESEHTSLSDPSFIVENLKSKIQFVEFENTTCSRAEIQCVLSALAVVSDELITPVLAKKVVVYSDSKTVVELTGRRDRLEQSNFIGKKSGKELSNADLYRKFYLVVDQINPELNWIKGHVPLKEQLPLNRIFSGVDRAVREKLRTKLPKFI